MSATSIELSPSAKQRMRAFLASDPEAGAVRLAVRKTGCSGYGYHVELATAPGADDQVLAFDGITVVVDPKSLPLLAGTRVDFARRGLGTTFVFHNPNATGACGCGESFTIAAEQAS